jgi:hypothetical protein
LIRDTELLENPSKLPFYTDFRKKQLRPNLLVAKPGGGQPCD